jgi:hypothetical protein
MSEQNAPGLIVYRENKPYVRRALGAGKVDYIDLTHWSFQDRFFAFLSASGFLQFAQMSFPTPRPYRCAHSSEEKHGSLQRSAQSH